MLGADVLTFGGNWERRRVSFTLTLPGGMAGAELQLEVPFTSLCNMKDLTENSFVQVWSREFGDRLGNEADGEESRYQMSALVVSTKANLCDMLYAQSFICAAKNLFTDASSQRESLFSCVDYALRLLRKIHKLYLTEPSTWGEIVQPEKMEPGAAKEAAERENAKRKAAVRVAKTCDVDSDSDGDRESRKSIDVWGDNGYDGRHQGYRYSTSTSRNSMANTRNAREAILSELRRLVAMVACLPQCVSAVCATEAADPDTVIHFFSAVSLFLWPKIQFPGGEQQRLHMFQRVHSKNARSPFQAYAGCIDGSGGNQAEKATRYSAGILLAAKLSGADPGVFVEYLWSLQADQLHNPDYYKFVNGMLELCLSHSSGGIRSGGLRSGGMRSGGMRSGDSDGNGGTQEAETEALVRHVLMPALPMVLEQYEQVISKGIPLNAKFFYDFERMSRYAVIAVAPTVSVFVAAQMIESLRPSITTANAILQTYLEAFGSHPEFFANLNEVSQLVCYWKEHFWPLGLDSPMIAKLVRWFIETMTQRLVDNHYIWILDNPELYFGHDSELAPAIANYLKSTSCEQVTVESRELKSHPIKSGEETFQLSLRDLNLFRDGGGDDGKKKEKAEDDKTKPSSSRVMPLVPLRLVSCKLMIDQPKESYKSTSYRYQMVVEKVKEAFPQARQKEFAKSTEKLLEELKAMKFV